MTRKPIIQIAKKTANRQRLGLTLVELLLALAIAVMLLAAAFRVTTVALRGSEMGRKLRPDVSSSAQLERLLTMDIHAGESYCVTKEGVFEIKLRACLDDKTLAMKHGQATVSYRIVSVDGRSWLVREQNGVGGVLRELAAVDVVKVGPSGDATAAGDGTWQDIPDKFAVSVEFAADAGPPLNVSCVLK